MSEFSTSEAQRSTSSVGEETTWNCVSYSPRTTYANSSLANPHAYNPSRHTDDLLPDCRVWHLTLISDVRGPRFPPCQALQTGGVSFTLDVFHPQRPLHLRLRSTETLTRSLVIHKEGKSLCSALYESSKSCRGEQNWLDGTSFLNCDQPSRSDQADSPT